MTFTFNTNIPAANNNPSVDQPDMLTNNQSTDALLAVDHVSFNALNGGQHKQVTFNNRNVPGAQTDPQAVLYTNTVMATSTNTASASTVSEMFYINQNSTYPISMIKAFGTFDSGGNPLNTWNMFITLPGGHPSTGSFGITMPANCVTGSSYLVLISSTGSAGKTTLTNSYTINSATSFGVQFVALDSTFQDPTKFSLLVLQL